MYKDVSQFEKEYRLVFTRANEDDENGNYSRAAEGYKKAAQMLVEYADRTDPAIRKAVLESASRLTAAAEQMKKMDQASGRFDLGDKKDDDEDISFKPTASHPNVHFDDIAGLDEPKRIIRSEIIQPRLYPNYYKRFNQDTNGGILLYGLPGTGKTMLAKCIATETKADFFSIRCSDIVGKWFGEAEKKTRALFTTAHNSQNAVLFFDEFDALAAKRGGSSTVMNRLVPELLSQMDGFESHSGRLTIIAATNTPWAIDSAFLRYPRFSYQICVPLPDDEARRYMLNKLLSSIPTSSNIDIEYIVDKTDGFTCADIKSLVNKSTRLPIQRCIDTKNENQYLEYADIIQTLADAHTSIQPEDVARLEAWNRKLASA